MLMQEEFRSSLLALARPKRMLARWLQKLAPDPLLAVHQLVRSMALEVAMLLVPRVELVPRGRLGVITAVNLAKEVILHRRRLLSSHDALRRLLVPVRLSLFAHASV